MTICTKADLKCKTLFPDTYLNSKKLLHVGIYKYFGHYITSTLSDDKDIMRQIRLNYARGNMLCRNFMYFTDDMKCMLFRSYMYNMYTICLWTNYTQSVYKKLMVSYNNSFHFLLKYPRSCSASEMFVHHNVKSFPECARTVSYSLLCRLCTSDNAFVNIYLNSIHWKKSKLLSIWSHTIYVRRDHK